MHEVRRAFARAGYQELVTYSFVESSWERDFAGNSNPIAVLNPIASQMAVMRSTVIGSLVAALAYRVLPPFWRVVKEPQPVVIRRAVKAGVLSLVLVDSAISASYAGPLYAAAVLATGLVAGSLARVFSVT